MGQEKHLFIEKVNMSFNEDTLDAVFFRRKCTKIILYQLHNIIDNNNN